MKGNEGLTENKEGKNNIANTVFLKLCADRQTGKHTGQGNRGRVGQSLCFEGIS